MQDPEHLTCYHFRSNLFAVIMLHIPIQRIRSGFDDIALPNFTTSGAAGMDVRAAVHETISIPPGTLAMIPTGLACSVPDGYEIQVRSRSGLAAKSGVFCLNAPGTIDSDYRGEISIILANFGSMSFPVQRGDRIAQFVVARFERVEWNEVSLLDETERGAGGFGSTGML
jgi:dUTP pyrophosphatase